MLFRVFGRSRAAIAALLLFVGIVAAGCGGAIGQAGSDNTPANQPAPQASTTAQPEHKGSGTAQHGGTTASSQAVAEGKGFPEFSSWNDPSSANSPTPNSAKYFVSEGSSAGAVPNVRPFNFGRDPGGPEDKTLSLTVPKLGINGVSAFNGFSEEKLKKGTIHVPATGFPWQKGANVYIAGHRIGYPGTPSHHIFYNLDDLTTGNEIILTDAAGKNYVYRVTLKEVVGPQNVEVMNPVPGKRVVTLQTCTLPDYKNRVIVQGDLVEGPSA